jgi:predicted transcriptional regulator
MAKFKEKSLARKLRSKGNSIKQIANTLGVSKGSVSRWCNDIRLSEKQKKILTDFNTKIIKKGSLVASENKKRERRKRIEYFNNIGLNKVGLLNPRELFLVGCALYWAEGGKTQRKTVFINSDTEMILIYIKWVTECLDITKDRLICRVEINEKYCNKIGGIEKYWSEVT